MGRKGRRRRRGGPSLPPPPPLPPHLLFSPPFSRRRHGLREKSCKSSRFRHISPFRHLAPLLYSAGRAGRAGVRGVWLSLLYDPLPVDGFAAGVEATRERVTGGEALNVLERERGMGRKCKANEYAERLQG
mmetsp:Transcript_28224/g.77154  ORF Transcript_28224/g.77154 Transcript_28224/m.77154 type:complete len:131 (+) Transcript_28224:1-393(+)